MKYRKKPVEIEAFQYDGDFQNREGNFYIPIWAIKAYKKGILFFTETEVIFYISSIYMRAKNKILILSISLLKDF